MQNAVCGSIHCPPVFADTDPSVFLFMMAMEKLPLPFFLNTLIEIG